MSAYIERKVLLKAVEKMDRLDKEVKRLLQSLNET